MRLFTAVQFDDETVEKLIALQEEMYRKGVRGTFQKREKLHLTTTFIGEYPDPDEIVRIIKEIPFEPWDLHILKPFHRDNTWVAEVAGPEGLHRFVRSFRASLNERSIPHDAREYKPHITLFHEAEEPLDTVFPFDLHTTVSSVSLFRSDLGEDGIMKYTELARISAEK